MELGMLFNVLVFDFLILCVIVLVLLIRLIWEFLVGLDFDIFLVLFFKFMICVFGFLIRFLGNGKKFGVLNC